MKNHNKWFKTILGGNIPSQEDKRDFYQNQLFISFINNRKNRNGFNKPGWFPMYKWKQVWMEIIIGFSSIGFRNHNGYRYGDLEDIDIVIPDMISVDFRIWYWIWVDIISIQDLIFNIECNLGLSWMVSWIISFLNPVEKA